LVFGWRHRWLGDVPSIGGVAVQKVDEVSFGQKIDSLDLIIEVLREHEKTLDRLINNLGDAIDKLDKVVERLDNLIDKGKTK